MIEWHAHPAGGHPEHYRRGLHVLPDYDEPMHWNRPDCWCGPTREVDDAQIVRWMHHASDGSETLLFRVGPDGIRGRR